MNDSSAFIDWIKTAKQYHEENNTNGGYLVNGDFAMIIKAKVNGWPIVNEYPKLLGIKAFFLRLFGKGGRGHIIHVYGPDDTITLENPYHS